MSPGRQTNSTRAARRALDELLADCFAARTLHDLSDALMRRVREALPAARRDLAWLGDTQRALARGLRGVCLADLNGQPEPAPDIRAAAENHLETELAQAAQRLQTTSGSLYAGTLLTAAAPSLVQAARGLAARSVAAAPLQAMTRLESEGAPPALLCRLDGHVLHLSPPLEDLCRRRQHVPTLVFHDALAPVHELARECVPLGGTLDQGARKSALGPRTGLHLTAVLQRHAGDVRSMFVEVVASEALRQTRLTARELQIARLLVTRGSYAEVARHGGIALDTVRTHVRRLYRKLAVSSREALRLRLKYEGLLPDDG